MLICQPCIEPIPRPEPYHNIKPDHNPDPKPDPWQRGEFVRLFAPAWALLEDGLAAALSDSLLRGYWADYMASEARGEPNAKHIQVILAES